MKQIKCVFNIFLLLTFVSFIFNTQIYALIEADNSNQIVKKYTRVNPEAIKKFEKVASVESLFDLDIDDIPSFDEVFQLMESFIFIDIDELATLYTQEELDIINAYLIKMARIGVLPGDEEELEKDIEELLSDDDDEEDENEDQYLFSSKFQGSSNYITSSEYKNWKKGIFCSNPIKKTIKSTKKAAKNTTKGLGKGVKKAGKFIKNNKAVVIAIVAVVVAGVTTYYIVSSNSSKPSSPTGLKNDPVKAENNNNSTISENVETTFDKDSLSNSSIECEKPIIAEILNDNITSFKSDMQRENSINIPESNQNIWNKTKEIFRDTSAHVTHKVLDEVSDYAKVVPMLMDEVGDFSKKFIQDELINDLQETNLFGNQEKSILENYEEKILIGHQKIDQLFAVNHLDDYAKEAKEYREKDFSIAILPPPWGLLKNAKALPNIKTPKDISNIMQPRGLWIGKKGNCERIRLFNGGKKEGIQIFKELTKDGKIIYKDSEKIISQLSDEIYITYRPISKSGPPTINIRLSNKTKPIKIKFIE